MNKIYKGNYAFTMPVNQSWSTTITFDEPIDTDKTNVILTGDCTENGTMTYTLTSDSLKITADHVHNGYTHYGWCAYSVVEYH